MIHWYTDKFAEDVHRVLRDKTNPICAELFPGFILSHAGFNRHTDLCTGRDEIIIKLHLRPMGEAMITDALLALKQPLITKDTK